MGLSVSDSALDLLGEAGLDSVDGARLLRRPIRTQLENPLAQAILAGKLAPGDPVEVDARDGQLLFERVVEGELVE